MEERKKKTSIHDQSNEDLRKKTSKESKEGRNDRKDTKNKQARDSRVEVMTGKEYFYYALGLSIRIALPRFLDWLDKREIRKREEIQHKALIEKRRVVWENIVFLARTVVALISVLFFMVFALDWTSTNIKSDMARTVTLIIIFSVGGLYITTIGLTKPLSQTLLSRIVGFFKNIFK